MVVYIIGGVEIFCNFEFNLFGCLVYVICFDDKIEIFFIYFFNVNGIGF